MRIRNRLLRFIIFPAILSLLALIIIVLYFFDSRVMLDSQTKIEAIASIQKNRVEELVSDYKNDILLMSGTAGMSADIEAFNKSGSSISLQSLTTYAIDFKLTEVYDFKDVFVLDKTGKIITSSNPAIDYEYLDTNGIALSSTETKIIIKPNDNALNDIILVAPVLNNDEFVGYVAILKEATELSLIANDYSGLGETGETVIAYRGVDGDAVYLTPPRFDLNTFNLTIPIEKTEIAIVQAMMKNEAYFKSSIAYNGQRINAATKYLSDVDWGMVVKVDKSEVNKPLYAMIIQVLSFGLLITVFYIILSIYFARQISRPIEKLRLGVEEIKQGNYTYRSDIKSKDEIGQLASVFNQMIISVVNSNQEVDNKVKSQTKEIIERQKIMNDQRQAIMNVLEDVEIEKDNTSQAKDKIDAVLHSIGDGVFVIDENFKIIIFNSVAETLSGFTSKQAIGKKYFDVLKFYSEDGQEKNDKFITDVFKTGKIQEMKTDTVLIKQDGKKIAVSDSSAPLKNRDGKIIGCVVVFRDVTHEREVDKVKTEFVSLASHQLRTPLSAVNWYTEMLIDGDAGKMNKQQKSYLDEIYRGNQRMVDLVNSLLNVSRLDLGTFEIVPKSIKFNDIVIDISKEMEHTLSDKKQKLINKCSADDPKMNVDPKLMRVIMQNLISNSIKYSPVGNKISVSMSYNPKNPESTFVIKVADNGYGIPNNQKDKIFTKLFRADNIRAMDTEGTGLGLYIVKSILDEAGGKIVFDSIENKGTTFTISLPSTGMKQKSGAKSIE